MNSKEKYYLSPNFCLNCQTIIQVKDNEYPTETRRRKFCSHNCSASFNNKGIKRNNIKSHSKRLCKCGKRKSWKSNVCMDCRMDEFGIQNRNLGSFITGHKYLTAKCQGIRSDARRVIERSAREKVCFYCENHDYDPILEVHHIKGILEFPETTLIKEINSEDNLVWLCPNDHAMAERKLIKV